MSIERLMVHLTNRELQIVEDLINQHYEETGIVLSKSNFFRSILLNHIKNQIKLF